MIYSQCLSETLTALSASNQKGHACFKSDPPKSLTVLERKKKIFPVHSFRMEVFSVTEFHRRAFKYVQTYKQVDKRDFLF